MNNVFKTVVKNTVGALAIAGFMAIAQAQSASALSLNFKPSGSQLDSDPSRDIATSVGSVLNFDLVLNTNGIGDNETVDFAEYILDWDATELGLLLLNFDPLGEILPPNGYFVDGSDAVQGSLLIGQGFVNPVAAGVNKVIGNISFAVLAGLNNSGSPDFQLEYLFPQVLGLQGSQIQSVEVQGGTAVPTPALLPGIFALGATAIRKRKQAAAV